MSDYDLELYKMKAGLCKTFSDPNRLVIINALRNGEQTVGQLVGILGIPQAAVSRHLGILRERGVVKPRREGTSIHYRLADIKIAEACDIVHEVLLNQIEKNRELSDKLANSLYRGG